MKAVMLNNTCASEELKVIEIDMPKIKKDWVLIKILGFGINRSEVILRQYEAAEEYIKLPIVPGIECIGKVVNPSNSDFKINEKVIALMGGMGRKFNGSYAEYALIPQKNLFKIRNETLKNLSLEEIIAIPETFFTAYGSIQSLNLKKEDKLLIRGATSALGLAAMQLAKAIGYKIIATSRKENRLKNLRKKGADITVVDNGKLENEVKCDKILELIGPATLEDSMKTLNENGICCVTGILGGVEYIKEFDPIKLIPNNRYLTSFFSNYPTQEIIDELYDFIIRNDIEVEIAKIFTSLNDIPKAHLLMESNEAQGKIIFKLESG